jgi:hypothetical protein
MGAWEHLVLEEAIGCQPSAFSQSSSLLLVLVLVLVLVLLLLLATHHDDTTARRRFPWHGRPARDSNVARLSQP